MAERRLTSTGIMSEAEDQDKVRSTSVDLMVEIETPVPDKRLVTSEGLMVEAAVPPVHTRQTTLVVLMVEILGEDDRPPFSYLDVVLEGEIAISYSYIDVILEGEDECPGRDATCPPAKIYRPHPRTRHHKRTISPVRR